jgi:thioredoxin 2
MIELKTVPCPSCKKTNRVDPSRAGVALCGACKTPLPTVTAPTTNAKEKMAHANVAPVNDTTFQKDVIDSALPVLVDFSATWCGPCRNLAPVVDKLAGEKAAKVKTVLVDLDESPQTAEKYGINAVPTLVLLKGGNEVTRLEGPPPVINMLREWLDEALSS